MKYDGMKWSFELSWSWSWDFDNEEIGWHLYVGALRITRWRVSA